MLEVRTVSDADADPQEPSRPPQEQLRIDLLNAFYTAFKDGVDPEDAEQHVQDTIEMAAEDAEVES